MAVGAAVVATPASAAPVVTAPPGQDVAAPADEMGHKLAAGRKALEQHNHRQAEARFHEAMALDRRSPLPLLEMAEAARVRGDAKAARSWLERAAALAPRHPHVLRAWAHWHYASGDRAKALASWQSAVAADARFVAAWVDLGDFQVNVAGDLSAAADHYRRALSIDPSHTGAHYALGVVETRLGRLEPAQEHLETAARRSPGNPLPLAALGELHSRRGALQDSIEAYDRALAVQPGFFAARLGKAEALGAGGQWGPALALYRQVARERPRLVAAHVGAGIAEQQLGRPDDALRSYRTALLIEPDHVVALNNAAWVASRAGTERAQALQWARRAAELAPDDPSVAGTLAWAMHLAGDTAAARRRLEQLVAGAGRQRAASHHLLGELLAAAGDAERASAELREGLRLDPRHPMAPEALALLKKLDVR